MGPHITVLGAAAGKSEPMPEPLPPPLHIDPGRGHKREVNAPDQIRPVSEPAYGTSKAYLLRRLARDAPEVLDRVKAGEFKSARAAAIEAGILKPVPTIRLVEDAAKVAAALRKHLSPE
jgi:hypothetical protein